MIASFLRRIKISRIISTYKKATSRGGKTLLTQLIIF